ncbi:response regulator transcription factor [Effusibacillus dendaii]|nr:response regulator [Effusibacillus dendaii]
MIVDDEQLEREVLTMIIKRHNFGVSQFFEAQNGADAVTLAKQEQMDLVLMDIKMPVMDGLTAAEIIKQEIPHCRVVFLTAYDERDFVDQTIGADDYLLKPAHPEDIRQALIKYIPVVSDANSQYPEMTSEHDDISKTVEYIEQNLHKELNLEILSGFVHLNGQYLSRLFKRKTGFTITQYITMRRLEKAKHLLDHTTHTISEISDKCGFTEPNYFARVFKKNEGVTPSQYQQQAIAARKKKLNSFGRFLM